MTETIHDIVVVGVPTAAILGGFLFQGRRFERLEDKIDRIDIKIDRVATEIRSEFRSELSSQIGSLRVELNALRAEVNARFDKMHSDLHTFFSLTGELKGRIEAVEKHQ